jgi:hypothetical protein
LDSLPPKKDMSEISYQMRLLGHKIAWSNLGDQTRFVCTKCSYLSGSPEADSPCGDPSGAKLRREKAVIDNQFAYKVYYKGDLVRHEVVNLEEAA